MTQTQKITANSPFERLAALDTASLCDINKNLRVFRPAIRPIVPGLKLIGKARTVSCKNDFLPVIQALYHAEPGEVIVIDGQGGDRALLGELFTAEARRKRLGGILIDGACRDTAGIKAMGFPIFAASMTPMAGTCRELGQCQIPIECGGVQVWPGDIVFGDDDGVLAIYQEELDELLDAAEQLQIAEGKILAAIRSGVSLTKMVNIDEHIDLIQRGQESTLKFIL